MTACACTTLPLRDRRGAPHPFTLVDSDAASASFIPASTSLSGPWLPTNPQPFIRLKGINVAAAVISSSTQVGLVWMGRKCGGWLGSADATRGLALGDGVSCASVCDQQQHPGWFSVGRVGIGGKCGWLGSAAAPMCVCLEGRGRIVAVPVDISGTQVHLLCTGWGLGEGVA